MLKIRSQELANCVFTPLICQKFPGGFALTPSSIGRAPFMRYVHKRRSQVRLTAHIVHEWINVSEISRISIFQSWQLWGNQIGWTTDLKATSGKTFIETLAGALWYNDGHHDGLGARACHVPSMLNQFQSLNKPELHKKRKVLRILKEMKHIHRNYLLFRLVRT